MAAKGADVEMMRLLAAHGADPNLANASGTTPLMAASGVEMFNPNEDSGTNEEALEAVRFALTLDSDVNRPNKQGETPLHGAAWRGANEIIQLLVDNGAKLDARSKRGSTPLMIANGEEERVATINVRPWAVELLVKLMKERGLPIEMNTSADRYAFEKQRDRQPGGGRGAGAGLPAGLDPETLQRLREQLAAGDIPGLDPDTIQRLREQLGADQATDPPPAPAPAR